MSDIHSKENVSPKWTFTVIMIPDIKNNGYTAFFAEYPNVVVEGDDKDEARSKLFEVMGEVFDYKRKQALTPNTSEISPLYITEVYNADLEPA